MLRDYGKVAQQARCWSSLRVLSPEQRALAQNLSDLANMLVDSGYGCPTEHLAAQMMFCHLCRRTGVEADSSVDSSTDRGLCAGFAGCPHVLKEANVLTV